MFLQFAQAWPQWRLDKITLGKALPVAKHDMVGVKEESATHYQLSNKKKKNKKLFFSLVNTTDSLKNTHLTRYCLASSSKSVKSFEAY